MAIANIKKDKLSSGDVDTASDIFAEHGDFIRSVIQFNVRNREMSEDLFQDMFIFFASKPIPSDVENIRAFIYRVVSDRVKDSYRSMDCYQKRLGKYAVEQDYNDYRCPEQRAIETEETEKMLDMIRQTLPEKQALAVEMRYNEDRDSVEVAEKMGIKSRSVSRYVCIGLKKIRQVFEYNQGCNL